MTEERNIWDENFSEENSLICDHDLKVLERARQTYGFNNQILVAVEELNELACVLTKYPRFDTHDKAVEALLDKALDEYADVLIVLNHVSAIFKLWDSKARERIYAKIRRLERWMDNDPRFQHTMEDRVVIAGPVECNPEELKAVMNFLYPKEVGEPAESMEELAKRVRVIRPENAWLDPNRVMTRLLPYCETCLDGCNKSDACPTNCMGKNSAAFAKNKANHELLYGGLIPREDLEKIAFEYSLNLAPDEIAAKIQELCGNKCPHAPECHDEHGYCLKYEKRQFLESELDRALSRI